MSSCPGFGQPACRHVYPWLLRMLPGKGQPCSGNEHMDGRYRGTMKGQAVHGYRYMQIDDEILGGYQTRAAKKSPQRIPAKGHS